MFIKDLKPNLLPAYNAPFRGALVNDFNSKKGTNGIFGANRAFVKRALLKKGAGR